MKKKIISVYECDWCEEDFNTEEECLKHETRIHKCPICKHGWFLYGSELTCDYNFTDCHFEPNE